MRNSAGYQYYTAELEIAFWSQAALNDGPAFCVRYSTRVKVLPE
jgi:hypothetical protein